MLCAAVRGMVIRRTLPDRGRDEEGSLWKIAPCHPGVAAGPGDLAGFLSRGDAVDDNVDFPRNGFGAQGGKRLPVPVATAGLPGPHQQVDSTMAPVMAEQAEKASLPVVTRYSLRSFVFPPWSVAWLHDDRCARFQALPSDEYMSRAIREGILATDALSNCAPSRFQPSDGHGPVRRWHAADSFGINRGFPISTDER